MIAQFMPYLTGKDEDAKRIAVRSIKEIGGVALAIDVVRSAPSDGTASALVAIAAQSLSENERQLANSAARQIFSDKMNRAFLVKGQGERPGFGRYSYLLIRTPAQDEPTRNKYLAAISAFVQRISRLEQSLQLGSKPSELNVTYVPVVDNPDSGASPEWILGHYDFSRASMILAGISGLDGVGPFLLSTAVPATTDVGSQPKIIQNLSYVPPGLVKAFIDEFFDHDYKEKNWTSSTMKELLNKIGAMLSTNTAKFSPALSR
jgi:hypothetical protein